MSPFVLEEIRQKIRELGFGEADAVGDLCFIVYAEMMRRWNESPRWTTIHYIKKEFVYNQEASEFLNKLLMDLALADKISLPGIVTSTNPIGFSATTTISPINYPSIDTHKLKRDDVFVAASLAFDVFMAFHGIPYEIKKKEENGDIL